MVSWAGFVGSGEWNRLCVRHDEDDDDDEPFP